MAFPARQRTVLPGTCRHTLLPPQGCEKLRVLLHLHCGVVVADGSVLRCSVRYFEQRASNYLRYSIALPKQMTVENDSTAYPPTKLNCVKIRITSRLKGKEGDLHGGWSVLPNHQSTYKKRETMTSMNTTRKNGRRKIQLFWTHSNNRDPFDQKKNNNTSLVTHRPLVCSSSPVTARFTGKYRTNSNSVAPERKMHGVQEEHVPANLLKVSFTHF